MTDRAEIERLLNATGRTLEGLPERYSWEEREAMWARRRTSGVLNADIILHQSDVIELLVGALRDALDVQKTELSDAEFEEFSKKCARSDDEEELMDTMINGRMPEEIKIGLRNMLET